MGWLSDWQYRKSHTISSANNAGTNYQVKIKVNYGSGTDSGENVYLNSKCRTDFADIRFTKSDGETLLDYWIEEKNDSDYAIVWVEIADNLSVDSTTIYIYYGKSDAVTASNPYNTLIKYGGFEDGTLSPFNNNVGGTFFSVTSAVKKWGNYGAECNDTGSATSSGRYSDANTFWALNKVAIEFWMRTNATSTSGGACSVYFIKNGYLRAAVSICDNGTFNYWTGSFITFGTSSKGTWYKFVVELDFDNSKWNFRIYNTARELLYNYTNLSMGSSSIGQTDVMMYSTVTLVGLSYWDEFFSRKWVSPEPSHGSWGNEETSGGGQQVTRVIVEYLAGYDVRSRMASLYRVKTDYVGLLDGRFKKLGRNIKEYIDLLDIKSRISSLHRTFIEYLGLLDIKIKKLSKVLKEHIGLLDIKSRISTLHRTFIEYVGLLDSSMHGIIGYIYRTVTEYIGLLDTKIRTVNLHKIFIEQLGILESKVKSLSKTFTEYIGLYDLIEHWENITRRIITEFIGLIDVVNKRKHLMRTFIEYVTVTETRIISKALHKIIVEYLGVKERYYKLPSFFKHFKWRYYQHPKQRVEVNS